MNGEIQCSTVKWYKDRSVFITGGSGFMGKILVEKLLYSCPGIKNVYLLMRTKRGKSPEERIEQMWELPMFKRLRDSQPNAIKKIVPLHGDLSSEGLGLNTIDFNVLINNVNVVFHCAATLRLEATLKDAIEQNTAGTARLVDIAKQIKKLDIFVHYSTAFCSADIDVFEEKVYDCEENPRDVIEVARWMRSDALEKVTKTLIAPHPNTYTYSKRLAEKLIANEAANLPVCIIRPSVVTPAVSEPLPGWVDSLNGPMGLIVGAGKGVIRSMHCKSGNRAHIIPVDMAINLTIIVAHKLATSKRNQTVPVYNLTQDNVIRVTYKEVLDRGRAIMYNNPFEMQIWYPDGDFRSSWYLHYIFCIFLHWIPAYFIDLLLFIFRQKRFMVRLQRRIHDGLELLQFFTVREWIFKSDNFLKICNEQTPEERKVFPLDFKAVPIETYLEVCVLGARQYLMKEDLSSLPRCRFQQKILFILHKTLVYSIYFYLFWSLISYSSTLRTLCASIPIIGSWLSSN